MQFSIDLYFSNSRSLPSAAKRTVVYDVTKLFIIVSVQQHIICARIRLGIRQQHVLEQRNIDGRECRHDGDIEKDCCMSCVLL